MSELRTDLLSRIDGTGPIELTAQWAPRVKYVYDHQTPVVNKAGNISSITDTSTGQHSPNFTNNFEDVYYVARADAQKDDVTNDGNVHIQCGGATTTLRTSALDQVHSTYNSSTAVRDFVILQYTAVGDLA